MIQNSLVICAFLHTERKLTTPLKQTSLFLDRSNFSYKNCTLNSSAVVMHTVLEINLRR